MTSYIEDDVRNCKWTDGQVLMLCSSKHSLGHVPEVMGLNCQLEKSFFFSRSPPDIRHEPFRIQILTIITAACLRAQSPLRRLRRKGNEFF